MRLKNKLRSLRQLITHGLAIAFGVLFAFSSLRVMPSQALSMPIVVDSAQTVAQKPPEPM